MVAYMIHPIEHLKAWLANGCVAPLDQIRAMVEGRSPHWPAVRRAFLVKHPTCAACGTRKNLEVHHCLPFHIDPSKELLSENLIVLCEGHEEDHFILGHEKNWKLWNRCVRYDAAKKLAAKREESFVYSPQLGD